MKPTDDYIFRQARARAGGYAKAARHSPAELTEAARRGRWASYLRRVDPNLELPEAERERRAIALRRSEMCLMGAKSAMVRRLKATPGDDPS